MYCKVFIRQLSSYLGVLGLNCGHMKERERQGQDLSQNELTRQADSSNLESGDIFMATDGGQEQNRGEGRPKGAENLTPDQRHQLEGVFNDPTTSVEARRAISSMLWGMDYEPPRDTSGGSREHPIEEPSEPWIGKGTPVLERLDQDYVPKNQPSDPETQGDVIQQELDELTSEQRHSAQQFIDAVSPELLAAGFTKNDIAHQAAVLARNPRAAEAFATDQQRIQERKALKAGNKDAVIERTQEEIKADAATIRGSESLQAKATKDALDTFIERAKDAQDLARKKHDDAKYKEYTDKIAKLETLRASGDLAGIKSELSEDFIREVRSYYQTIEGEVPDIPESLEDLAALVMKREGEEWKTGGKKELIDSEGKVVKENFMAWVRKKMIDMHDFFPTSTVDFFSGIFVKGRWSQISLQEMVLTGSYFLEKKKEKVVVGKKADGTIEYEEKTTYHKNEDYEKLKHQLLMEAFLFQTSRNAHVEYINVAADDVELPKLLSRLYATNVFTRGDNLEFILSMPSMDKDKETDEEKKNKKEGKEIETKLEHNFEIGQAARKLLMAYYYIYDYDTLQKILGPDAVFFQETYRNINSDTGTDAVDGDGKKKDRKRSIGNKSNAVPYDPKRWYNKNGRVDIKGVKDKADFMEYINVFTGPGPNKDARIIDEVRERMVQSMMEKMGLDYSEAKYAEAWAFSMTNWTGLAGKNDTAAVGHDAWAKVQNTQEYRFRQMADKRNALFGNIFNVLGIKRLGVSWFEGIRDTEGRTIIEAIQGGEGAEMDLDTAIKLRDKQNKGKPITFNDKAMALFSANHINNTFFLQEFLIDHNGFNFQDFLTIDSMGRPVIDYEKANKIIGGVDKAIRYAYSTWIGTDYSKTVRTWEMVEEQDTQGDAYGAKGKVIHAKAKDLPIIAELFGEEILSMLKEEALIQTGRMTRKEKADLDKMTPEGRQKYLEEKGRKKDITWNMGGEVGELNVSELQSQAVREVLWKSVMQYLVQAEIESHRNIFSDQERFNMLKMEQIYDFLKQKHIFTDKQINEIRKETHSTIFGMMLQEAGGSILAGLMEAMKKARASSSILVN